MTANIINFSDAIFKRYGMGFMLCPRCNDQTCFLPVVEQDGEGLSARQSPTVILALSPLMFLQSNWRTK